MTLIEQTAYPRLKRTLTSKELDQIYLPTPAELFLAHRTAKGSVATLGFLVHLKVFQRLGYAVATSEIPISIIEYIAVCAHISLSPRDLAGYDDSGTRRRHLPLIREALDLRPYDPPARKAFLHAMVEAARTKDDLAEMLIKRMLAIHQKGKEALQQSHLEHQARTDALVTTSNYLISPGCQMSGGSS